MKKTIYYLLVSFAVLSIFCACEEVIDLPLDTAQQRPVIEAILDGNTGKCTVTLTKSGSFYQKTDFETISNAKITLKTPSGTVLTLKETTKGKYSSESTTVVSGKPYTITVEIGSQAFSSTTVAPYPAKLLELSSEPSPVKIFNDTTTYYEVVAYWEDPSASKNYYNMRIFGNDTLRSTDKILLDDKNVNGQLMDAQSYYFFKRGTRTRVELLSIDSLSYEYLKQVSELSRSVDKFYNPKSPFGANAFGFFNIAFSDVKTLTL